MSVPGAASVADDQSALVSLVRLSPMFDDDYYRSEACLSKSIDTATHYAVAGWRQGLQTAPDFDSEFLSPYYRVAGWEGPALAVWTMLSTSGPTLPANAAEASKMADLVRESPYFDSRFYAEFLPSGMDPALHYTIIGERMRWRPSMRFDPAYYGERYPDTLDFELGQLRHYETFGRSEQRRATSVAEHLNWPILPPDERPVVVVISHEASRTGAPILSWNVGKALCKKYRVINLLLNGGALEANFKDISAGIIGPLGRDDWHPAEMRRIAHELVARYRPLYVVANSIETHPIVPPLASLGIPTIALVHEFASYTRPVGRMKDIFDWAPHVIFPARLVAQSSFDAFPQLQVRRGVCVFPQGPSIVPQQDPPQSDSDASDGKREEELASLVSAIRPLERSRAFVVLGMGTIQIRKGIDIFIATAAACRRMRPDINFRFVWIGHGYDPIHDSAYSVYLAEQIARSGLSEIVIMHDGVDHLEPAYAEADAFLLSSRLDPQPNVGIDAMVRGIPVVCFTGASGTAEILSDHPHTRDLVVPYLDAHAAARSLCALASKDADELSALHAELAELGRSSYDMERYIARIDAMGNRSAAALRQADAIELANAGIVDAGMALRSLATPLGPLAAEWHFLQQWHVMQLTPDPDVNAEFRRPCPGFHPQVYADAHRAECLEKDINPLLHWMREGRPAGPWFHRVYTPGDRPTVPTTPADGDAIRIALHGHFCYPELATELRARLSCNSLTCDLFITTDSAANAAALTTIFGDYPGSFQLMLTPGNARNLGAFVTGVLPQILKGYDVIGHVHGERSRASDNPSSEQLRLFLGETLIGGEFPMMDLAAAAFAGDPGLGLLMAEDPHLAGWRGNRAIAETLAARMGVALSDYFDFPSGGMFWARAAALRPLLNCGLGWDDYPATSLPNDSTVLHAIERLLPFIVQKTRSTVAGMHIPGGTW